MPDPQGSQEDHRLGRGLVERREFSDEFEDAGVRGRELVIDEFIGLHPSDFITANRSRRAAQPNTLKEMKGYGLRLVVMVNFQKKFLSPYGDSQLFPYFPFQARGEAFVFFLLPTGKFPIAPQVARFGPSRDQDSSVMPDKTRGHVEMRVGHV